MYLMPPKLSQFKMANIVNFMCVLPQFFKKECDRALEVVFPSSFIPGSPLIHGLCDFLIAGSLLELGVGIFKTHQRCPHPISRTHDCDL